MRKRSRYTKIIDLRERYRDLITENVIRVMKVRQDLYKSKKNRDYKETQKEPWSK